MKKIYHKLVRDKIPEIILSDNGRIPVTRILSDEEYKKELEKKLLEEYYEVLEASGEDRIEELADMLEVMKYLAELEQSTFEEVVKKAKTKKIKRGGFEKKIYLEQVISTDE